ncbi:MAG: hypothetical protein AAF328_11050 [Planctomycetota bacterium]
MEHIAKYLPIIESLAAKALDMAVDASPTKPRAGSTRISLVEVRDATRTLIDSADAADIDRLLSFYEAGAMERDRRLSPDGQTLADEIVLPTPMVVDGYGHERAAYALLFRLISLRAAASQGVAADHELWAGHVLWDAPEHREDFAWSLLHLAVDVLHAFRNPHGVDMSVGFAEHDVIAAWSSVHNNMLSGSEQPAPLQAQQIDVAPDEWTYREMVGLHAAMLLATELNHRSLVDRCHAAARYHLQHTQPDYTTYQPWALAAFLYFPDTVGFAEQQLHDVETHLHVEGPPGALVPGLLLADAYATLKQAMSRDNGDT